MDLCEYGCGQEAKFVLKNGKHCCSISFNKCPEVRRKNSLGVAKAHKDGRLVDNLRNKNWSKGKCFFNENDFDKYFCENSYYRTDIIKQIIINKKYIDYKCDMCGNNGTWNGKKLVLQLDHINGNNKDQRLMNLRFLCPNCHAQTDTFCGKNVNRKGNFVNEIEEDKLIECLKNSKSVQEAAKLYNLQFNKRLEVYGHLYYYIKKLLLKYKCFIGQDIIIKNEAKLIKNTVLEKEQQKIEEYHSIAIKINTIMDSNIDFSKFGWVQKVSEILKISPQKTRKWVQRNYPLFLENAFRRKYV